MKNLSKNDKGIQKNKTGIEETELIKYINSDYITETMGKTSWSEAEEQDFYIKRASSKIRTLIFSVGDGNPDDITTYTTAQQSAIKEATALYTLYYYDMNYDFTEGSVSLNFGGASMSESRTWQGEKVLPNIFEILKRVGLIPTDQVIQIDMFKNKTKNNDPLPSDWQEQIDQINITLTNQAIQITKQQGIISNLSQNKQNNILAINPLLLDSNSKLELDQSDIALLSRALNNFKKTVEISGKLTMSNLANLTGILTVENKGSIIVEPGGIAKINYTIPLDETDTKKMTNIEYVLSKINEIAPGRLLSVNSPLLIDRITNTLSIDLSEIASQEELDALILTVSGNRTLINENMDDTNENFVNKNTTEKQFIVGDINHKGNLQKIPKAVFNADVLNLEDGNDLYIPKSGNSIFGTLIGESLSSGKLYNREIITSNMSGKTAINKEYLDPELAKKQNTLIAGTNIIIDGDTINATGGGKWIRYKANNPIGSDGVLYVSFKLNAINFEPINIEDWYSKVRFSTLSIERVLIFEDTVSIKFVGSESLSGKLPEFLYYQLDELPTIMRKEEINELEKKGGKKWLND